MEGNTTWKGTLFRTALRTEDHYAWKRMKYGHNTPYCNLYLERLSARKSMKAPCLVIYISGLAFTFSDLYSRWKQRVGLSVNHGSVQGLPPF